jgi:hypothetical protein
VLSKSRIFKFLKRDCGTIPVAEITSGKIEIFSKHQRFLIVIIIIISLLILLIYQRPHRLLSTVDNIAEANDHRVGIPSNESGWIFVPVACVSNKRQGSGAAPVEIRANITF